MNAAGLLADWPEGRIRALIDDAGPTDVERALARPVRDERDLAALLSSAARSRLEAMAHESRRLTRRFFGRVIGLFSPLYLSNVCTADCRYCGFAARGGSGGPRLTLSPEEIDAECAALAAAGFRNVLLVSGDAPGIVTTAYLEEAVSIARAHLPSVSVEVYSLDEEGYRRLARRGIEGVTLYMETYDRETYAGMHRRGTKRDFDRRLEAISLAGRAGVRRLNAGALLGLFDWRVEGFRLALHARHLQRAHWRSAVAVSFPRLRHVPDGFEVPAPVDDASLVQLMLALRLFLPEAGFTLSTRERAALRDRLMPLGVTLMSAGSSTRPGGYAHPGGEALEQFEIEDRRSPGEVARAIRRAGYDPVWKDFDLAFDEAEAR